MEDFITLFLVIFLSYVFSLVFSKANLPKLVAPLLIGTFFGLGFLEKLFITPSVLTIITFVKDIAIIFLMFFVGLKIDFRHFVKSSRRSIYIAVFGSMIPFLLGFFGTLLAYHVGFLSSASFSGESLFVVAYVVGLCISVTAEVVLIEILQELKIIKSLTGETIIEAGLIDSLLGILLLSGLVAFLPSNSGQSESLLSIIGIRTLQIAIFGFLVFLLGKYFVPKIMKETVSQKERNINFFTIAIIIAFCLALISILLDFGGSMLGAIIAGIIIRHTLLSGNPVEKKEEYLITEIIEITTFGFFAYFFFFWIGLTVDFSVLFVNPLLLLYFFILGFAGKFLSVYLANRITYGTHQEGVVLGAGMNARGELDIMVATMMFSAAVISLEIFSALILVSFIATILSTILFRYFLRRYHGI